MPPVDALSMLQHEARVQKLAEQKLAASGAGAAAAAAAAASAAPKAAKQAPLLFDLVFEGETELCIKVGGAMRRKGSAHGGGVRGKCTTLPALPACLRYVSVSEPPLPRSQAKRDTRNPTMLSTERQLGSFRTTNSVHQAAVTAHSPPKAAGGWLGCMQGRQVDGRRQPGCCLLAV